MATLDNDDKKWLKKNMITRSDTDVNSIKDLIGVAIDEKVEEKKLVVKGDISHLPTKDEFYAETSKIYKKLENLETEIKLVTRKVSEHSDDIEKLKDIHPGFHHVAI